MTARARAQRPPRPGDVAGSPCPYSSEFSDELCGEPADHWSSAINRYLCAEHYHAVKRQFASAAVEFAAACPDCGELREDCHCSGQEDD